MTVGKTLRLAMLAGLVLAAAGCGGRLGDMFRRSPGPADGAPQEEVDTSASAESTTTLWDLFENRDDPNTTVEVNRYIWNAALEVLSFLPVESVDPFSGVIVMGYGVPPGGGRAYRATVYVQDPALDARSLKVALETRGGAVPDATVRAVEDAILARARQLRIRDRAL
ncbi:MAG: DUF3576 domain-containing protein [Rhodobacteraceae bacterium]|nr:DUF3576 domain-containing protein [Paracoccaceae bacterium]